LIRKWCGRILRNWRMRWVTIVHIKWVYKPLRHHQKVREGEVQGCAPSITCADRDSHAKRESYDSRKPATKGLASVVRN
jgi:hypothetical protein